MGKLFRSIHSENVRLYSGFAAVLAIVAVLLISLCTAWVIGANAGKDGFLPASVIEEINSSAVNAPTEYTVEIITGDTIQEVITNTDISNSDASGTDISASDVAETVEPTVVTETHSYESWQDAYRARYAQLAELNTEYGDRAKTSTGAKREYYVALQQECIREALVINECLELDSPVSASPAWNVVYLTLWLMLLPVGVIAAAVMSGKTAGEFKSGVMYTLYTLPVTRLKLYFAKLFSTALFALMLCAIAWAGAVIGGVIGCGELESSGAFMKVLGEEVTAVGFFDYSLEPAFCLFISVLILITFCGAVSTLTRSQGAAVALTAVIAAGAMIFGRAVGSAGNIVCGLSIISVLDVSAPLRGVPNYASAGYIVSWLSAAVHALVCVILGYIGMRKDAR